MKLLFVKPYLSIKKSFKEIELPNFTLITGLNGSGKSHFLKAIENGSISSNIAANTPQDRQSIRLIESSHFNPTSSSGISAGYLKKERVDIIKRIQQFLKDENLTNSFRLFIENNKLPSKFFANPSDLLNLSRLDFFALLRECRPDLYTSQANNYNNYRYGSGPQHDPLEAAYQNLNNMFDVAISRSYGGLSKDLVAAIRRATKKSPAAATEADLANIDISTYGDVDLFSQSFARLFETYRDRKWQNLWAQFLFEKKGRPIEFLTDDQFVDQFGPPPWDEVNDIFSRSKLDFVINKPVDSEEIEYKPILVKKSTLDEVSFESLSSGEKVIMSFVLSIFYSLDERQSIKYPKILLLDEFDAHLHPSMCADMLNIILDVIVGKYGTKVIATTHSPTTVALSPNEAIFVVDRDNGGIRPEDKDCALNALTHGLPTLSISNEKRIQIFVESKNDEKLLGNMYNFLKAEINSPKSLYFIAVGHEKNGGCDQVKSIVSDLQSKGNKSVFGIIDWDGKNKSTEHVFVMAEDRRNGIESLILDPLALILFFFRDRFDDASKFNFSQATSYRALEDAGIEEWQSSAGKLVSHVLNKEPTAFLEHEYCGGMRLKFDRDWSSMNDHDLEALVINKFPFLKFSLRGSSSIPLKDQISSTIYRECPHFIPVEIRDILELILRSY